MWLYCDCFSGISGDMTLGALVDLGVSPDWLVGELHKLGLAAFNLEVSKVQHNGISASNVNVIVQEHHTHRHYADIAGLIQKSALSDRVKTLSLAIFDRLAEAESRIHDCSKERVHFHEVGGVDAIVDIVGSVLGLEYLGIQRVFSSHLPLGNGFVTCRHGILPIPAPAVLAILKQIPVYGTAVPHELITPTGAAIIATLSEAFGPMPRMCVEAVGYGAGDRRLEDRPNLLRLVRGKGILTSDHLQEESLIMVEACIDDMNPELFGHLMERLFSDGAKDVYWIPVYMKKNRPGTMVQVLCTEDYQQTVIRRILNETTSLGVRHYIVGRTSLPREIIEIQTPYGILPVKKILSPEGSVRLAPEFEVCRKIALEKDLPLPTVYEHIKAALSSTAASLDDQ